MSETGTRRSPSPGRPAPEEGEPRPVPTAERPHPQAAPAGPKAAPQPGDAPYSPFPGGGAPRGPRGGKRRIPWLWIIAGLCLAGLVAYAVWPKPAVQGPGQFGGGRPGGFGGPGGGRFGGAPTSVNVGKVAAADVPVYLNGLGTVTPTATVVVRPQVSGQIVQVGFQEGQTVRKGQFLAQIDPRPFQQALNQAQGVLARDQATLQNARVVLERYRTLLAQDSIARQQVDDQEALVRSSEATVRTDQAAVDAAKLNLEFARITSPVSGRVGLRRVDPGNYITSGDANGLVVVTEIDPIDVLFTAPEDQLPQLTKRIKAGGPMKAEAFDRSQSTKIAEGQFLTLDNQVDTATGTVKIKARFANADASLFPNQFVNIRLLVDTVKGAMTVPSSAVLRGSQGLFVYVVQPDRTVTVRPVTPGVVSGAQTVITSGLKLGETVVIDGADRLREGARVMLPGDCPPAIGQGGQGRRQGQGGQGQGGQGQGGQGQGGQARNGAGAQAGCTPAPAAGPVRSGQGFGEGGGGPGGPSTPLGSAPQGQAVAGQGGGGFGGRALAELNLDPAQLEKARAAFAAARARAEQSPGDPDARRQALRKAFADIEPILRPDQKEKLRELQARGPGAGGPQGPN